MWFARAGPLGSGQESGDLHRREGPACRPTGHHGIPPKAPTPLRVGGVAAA